jgi:hypothetical protein
MNEPLPAFLLALSRSCCLHQSIKQKPQVDKITDKLLISLDPSFAAIRTNLADKPPSSLDGKPHLFLDSR